MSKNPFLGKVLRSHSRNTEVNPTYSLKKAPTATPSNGGKQVNPTVSANKSQSAVSAPKANKERVNPTYSVANKGKEISKGTSQKTLNKTKALGKPLSTKKNPRPVFKATIKGTKTKGLATPTKNEAAPYGANARKAAPMTLGRLKKMGY